ncbi:hypothetical protein [Patulibacter sp.]|uniref:hypothetical protein n=1 Tax=Patulibacter sp. TaxID=1912859 RepID=UPI00271F61C1|nr:hypothetical protein [Patulibacter sp.]MDO9410267.1 hypothetical protein [Patulibacter sp.]
MTFRQLLHATVLLSGASATLLGLIVVSHAQVNSDPMPAVISALWWIVASILGINAGRMNDTNPQIARVLAEARAAEQLPEPRPVLTLINRLWPLFAVTIVSGVAAIWLPQVAGVATGFLLIWALGWRKQEHAVKAIEERDGVEFLVERTGPVSPLKLLRTPGLRRDRPEHKRHSASA